MRPKTSLSLLSVGVLTAWACATSGARFVTPTTSDRFFIAGYHPYWAGDAWTSYRLDAVDEIYFFEVEVASNGTFLDRHGWPTQWQSMVDAALGTGTQVTPTVSMHDPEAFVTLFGDDRAIERLVSTILDMLVATPALAGIHLDFEVFQPVAPRVRDGYTSFVARLRHALHEHDPGLALSVFTLAFDDDDVYDEPALGAIADYLVLQGYDYHSSTSANAGPVAPLAGWGRLNWNEVLGRFDDFGVPRRKLVISVPLYGYQWPVTSDLPGAAARDLGVAIPLTAATDVQPELPRAYAQAARHDARRDPASGSPFYVFRDAEGWHQGWFEDVESLSAKYDFVRRNGLGGVALFPLAYADAAVWNGVTRAFSSPR